MKITFEPHYDVLIVKLDGTLDTRSAGAVSDALVAQIRTGWRKVVIDFNGLQAVTRGGVRALVVAATLLREQRGQMLICRADARTEAFLKRISFRHLLNFDATRDAAVQRLGYRRREDVSLDGAAGARREKLGFACATAPATGAAAGRDPGTPPTPMVAPAVDGIPTILRVDRDQFRRRPRSNLARTVAAPMDR